MMHQPATARRRKGLTTRIFLFVFLLLAFAKPPSFASESEFDAKDLMVLKTTWFDIIYPPASERTARLLAEEADQIYRDINAMLGREPWFRMPVVIIPSYDEFNAYYSRTPYNHIVMYDTAPEETMAVFSQQLFSVFKHELTHAVTYNLRSPFWRKVSSVLGDVYNPALLTVTRSVAEGATVSLESSAGEGRLNDGYSQQLIRQAKIEGRFPGWADIQGAKERYPTTRESYLLGGAFASWLQHEYGMEKYALYWERMVNLRSLAYFTAFKKVYGVSIESAWEQFKESVVVPDITSNPLEANGYRDLFSLLGPKDDHTTVQNMESYSPRNSGGALYDSLSSSPGGLIWRDIYSSTVWFAPRSADSTSYGSPEKLFSMSSISRLSQSSDGKYLAVSFTSDNDIATRNQVKIYDLKLKKWFTIKEKGLRDATIIRSRDAYYLAAIKTHSQYANIKLYRLEGRSANGGIDTISEERTIRHPFGDIPFSLIDSGNGSLSYIYKTSLQWSIRRYDLSAETVSEWRPSGDNIVLRNLALISCENDSTDFFFSFSRPETLPRLGHLRVAGGAATFYLQADDVSGGIHYPVPFSYEDNTGTASMAAYIGKFYNDYKLLCADVSQLPFESSVAQASEISLQESVISLSESAADCPTQIGGEAEKYNELYYYRRGYFWPAPATSKVYNSGSIEESSSFPIGVAYITGDPWDGGRLLASASQDILSGSFLGMVAKSGGTWTDLLKYAVQAQIEFDGDGYKQTYEVATLSTSISTGNISSVTILDAMEFFEGRQNKRSASFNDIDSVPSIFDLYKNDDDTERVFGRNVFAAEWSTIRRSGLGYYSLGGMSITPALETSYYSELHDSFDKDNIYNNISLEMELWIPGLLPIIAAYPNAYNMPGQFRAELFSSSSYFLDTEATVYLYTHEVQKAPPLVPILFVQRFNVSLSYVGKFTYGTVESWDFFNTPDLLKDLSHNEMDYYDTVSITAELLLSPNAGMIANPMWQLPLSVSLLYRVRPEDDDSHWAVGLMGMFEF